MRNGKHYVSVRLTKAEKENFLALSKACGVPENTLLYWLVNNMPIHERPPEAFFKLNSLFMRTGINVGNVWLCSKYVSEPIRNKYHDLSREIGNYDNEIFRKIMFF